MVSDAKTVEAYLEEVPENRKETMSKLRQIIKSNLPSGFEESMGYGMIGYGIPHQIYPAGYHVTPSEPVPFMGLASQKNFIAIYYMGFMVSNETLNWFQQSYSEIVPTKLDMGKSCIRLKKVENIPYELIAELCQKITVEEYLEKYEKMLDKLKNKKRK